MKNFFLFANRSGLVFLLSFWLLGSLPSHAITVTGTLKQGSAKNSVDVFFKSNTANSSLKFTATTICVSIPTVSPLPTVVITPNQAAMGGGIIMVPNSTAAGGFPVAYNGRLYYMWVQSVPATAASVFSTTEFAAFNISFTGGTTSKQVQLNDNQTSTRGVYQLANAQFYVEMQGLGQVSPDPTNGSGYNYQNVYGTPFYPSASSSTSGPVNNPASASNPVVTGGTDYYAQTVPTVPLPVQLTAFTAVKKQADGLLSWSTASELKSDYFELQASANGTTWEALGRQAGAGTSTAAREYSYLDKTIARYGAPLVYYRLRQVDLDGSAQFSPVVTLSPGTGTWTVAAYPNPYESDLTAQLISAEAGPVTLTMLDATGRTILRREIAGVPGLQVIALDESHTIATGTYTLLVRQNGHTGTVRVVRK